jgi:hypothetical protein
MYRSTSYPVRQVFYPMETRSKHSLCGEPNIMTSSPAFEIFEEGVRGEVF